MKEEDVIRKKAGTKNPFKVPENYFEEFSKRVIKQLPAQQETKIVAINTTNRTRIFRRLAIACSIATVMGFALFGIRFLSKNTWVEKGQYIAVEQQDSLEKSYLEEMLDYAMIDNQEIYAYLSETE